MKKYKCHKVVEAMLIDNIEIWHDGSATLNKRGAFEISVGAPWMEKHHPQSGGYYVRYKDGYSSYSPAEAFEEGYSLFEAHGNASVAEH